MLKTIRNVNPLFIEAATFVVLLCGLPLIYNLVAPILPTVMQDELVYRENARLGRTEPIEFPNYLYLRLYGLLDVFGNQFYLATKLLNTIFHLASALLLLFWFRKSPAILRALGALIYFCAPFVSFTSVYMPEPLYAFFAILSILLFLSALKSDGSVKIPFLVSSAAGLSLAQLSKPHGVFLLFGILVFLILLKFFENWKWRKLVTAMATYLGTFLAIRLAVGFALVGHQSLNFTGNYTSNTDSVLDKLNPDSLQSFLLGLPLNLLQHSLVLAIYLAPILYSWLTTRWKPSTEFTLLLVLLSVLIVVIALFESYLTYFVGDNHQERVLLRHYEFLVPLIWLAFFRIHNTLPKTRDSSQFSIAMSQFIFVTAFMAFALTEGALWTASRYSDSGLTGALGDPAIRWVTVACWLMLFVLFTRRKVPSTITIAGIVLVAIGFAGLKGTSNFAADNSVMLPSDKAAVYVRENLEDFEGSQILVVGSDKALTEASVFQMNKPGIKFRIFADGTALDPIEAIDDVDVIVQIGNLGVLDIGQEVIEGDGYSISIFR